MYIYYMQHMYILRRLKMETSEIKQFSYVWLWRSGRAPSMVNGTLVRYVHDFQPACSSSLTSSFIKFHYRLIWSLRISIVTCNLQKVVHCIYIIMIWIGHFIVVVVRISYLPHFSQHSCIHLTFAHSTSFFFLLVGMNSVLFWPPIV